VFEARQVLLDPKVVLDQEVPREHRGKLVQKVLKESKVQREIQVHEVFLDSKVYKGRNLKMLMSVRLVTMAVNKDVSIRLVLMNASAILASHSQKTSGHVKM
jgi:hypothetical protein